LFDEAGSETAEDTSPEGLKEPCLTEVDINPISVKDTGGGAKGSITRKGGVMKGSVGHLRGLGGGCIVKGWRGGIPGKGGGGVYVQGGGTEINPPADWAGGPR